MAGLQWIVKKTPQFFLNTLHIMSEKYTKEKIQQRQEEYREWVKNIKLKTDYDAKVVTDGETGNWRRDELQSYNLYIYWNKNKSI